MRRTDTGHIETTDPGDAPISAAAVPEDDGDSGIQVLAGQEAAGPAAEQNVATERRHLLDSSRSKNAQLAAALLEKLQAEPGRVFKLSQLVEEFQRPAKDVSNALVSLRRIAPEIGNPVRGCWVFADGVEYIPASTHEPARAARRVRKWAVKGRIEEWVKSHPRETFVPTQIADELEVEVRTVNEALFSLRDYLGEELQKPGRGTWRYEPAGLEESQEIRQRLRAIRHELSTRDESDLSPLVRRLLFEEETRLMARLASPPSVIDLTTPPEPASAPAAVPSVPGNPPGLPTGFQAVTVHGTGVVLTDDHGELWLAHHIDIDASFHTSS